MDNGEEDSGMEVSSMEDSSVEGWFGKLFNFNFNSLKHVGKIYGFDFIAY